MTRRMWVDRTGAKRGAIVLGLGLVLLLVTPWLSGGDPSTPSCSSLSDPVRARECVSSSAQAIDRGSLALVTTVVLALAAIALGGALVLKSRRRVMDIVQAAMLMGIDVPAVRSLIVNGDLVPVMSEGRIYVDVAEVERLTRATNAPGGMATSGSA